MDHIITTWTNKLKYVSTSLGEYEYRNRYEQAFMDMVEAKGYNYTLDDVAIAQEVIEMYYGEEYTMRGYSVDYSALPDGEFGWPVPANKVVSAIFGYSSWYGDDHVGIDVWAVDSTGTPSASLSLKATIDIVAARDGVVEKVFNGGCKDTDQLNDSCGGGYGNYVLVDHGDGYTTMYAHLSPNTISVRDGQQVTAGQYLGKMGTSGNSNGVHLHYEIRYNNQRLDPLFFYDVESYNYSVPYANKNRNAITMANPYKVNFTL